MKCCSFCVSLPFDSDRNFDNKSAIFSVFFFVLFSQNKKNKTTEKKKKHSNVSRFFVLSTKFDFVNSD